jgi:hypothetical protein
MHHSDPIIGHSFTIFEQYAIPECPRLELADFLRIHPACALIA